MLSAKLGAKFYCDAFFLNFFYRGTLHFITHTLKPITSSRSKHPSVVSHGHTPHFQHHPSFTATSATLITCHITAHICRNKQ